MNGQRLVYKFVNLPRDYTPSKKLDATRLRQLANTCVDVSNKSDDVETAPPTMATKMSVIKSVSEVAKSPPVNSLTQEMFSFPPNTSETSRSTSSGTVALYESKPILSSHGDTVTTTPVYLQPITTLAGGSELCGCRSYTLLQPITHGNSFSPQTLAVLQTPCCGKVSLAPLAAHQVLHIGRPATPTTDTGVFQVIPRAESRTQTIEA